ncbi:hypothetical protein HYV49_04915 [Candidatus Pacearchaeota archaeon]|nr:hypothetical protein [Candidatus Pacearchaeota archaeon]
MNENESCLICKKEIAIYNGEVCKNCLQFFQWKYKKKWKKEMKRVIDGIEEAIAYLDSLDNLNNERRKK